MFDGRLEKILLKTLIVAGALVVAFFVGAYQDRSQGWPFGSGHYERFHQWMMSDGQQIAEDDARHAAELREKEARQQTERQIKQIELAGRSPAQAQQAEETRRQDLEAHSFISPQTVLEQLVKSPNSMAYLYSDIPYLLVSDASYCPGLARQFFDHFSGYEKHCYRIYYRDFEFDTYAVKILAKHGKKAPKRLLIYNQGHTDLSDEAAPFAAELFDMQLRAGTDILVTSLPFLGLNSNTREPMRVKTYDGVAMLDLNTMDEKHELFELFDTGASHYMRFFIDSAVLPVAQMAREYQDINYLGFSGGATIGLHTCLVLKDVLNRCVLVAGVMPANLGLTLKTFGDAEQVSASFRKKHRVMDELDELAASRVAVTLVYNDQDACCFDQESAVPFKVMVEEKHLPIQFMIRNENHHQYDPKMVSDVLSGLTP